MKGKQKKVAAHRGSVNLRSSLSPNAQPFEYQQQTHITPSKVVSQKLPLHPARRNRRITQSDPLATAHSSSNSFDPFEPFMVNIPPIIPRYSEAEKANYFKARPLSRPTVSIDPVAWAHQMASIHGDSSQGSQYSATKTFGTIAAPRLLTYYQATGVNEGIESAHMWISKYDQITVTDIIPAIPAPYAKEAAEGRALYVIGVPPGFMTMAFMSVFKSCGKVDKCPAIIDINTNSVFRWVIMETAEQANIAMETRSGLNLAYNGMEYTIYICKAMAPGNSIVLSGHWNMERYFFGNYGSAIGHEQDTTHAHPEAPIESPAAVPRKSAPLAPIPKTLLPSVPSSSRDEIISTKPETVDPAATEPVKATPKFSWANVAGTVVDKSKTIDLRPENKSNSVAPRIITTGRIPSVTRGGRTESLTDQARVVFLLELPQNLTLQDISDAIREGPVHTIQFGTNEDTRERYAGVIFQYARDAESFFQALCKERADSTPGRFRFIVEARRSEEPFVADEALKLMGAPTFATRRLTIVKSRFFFVYKEPQLRALCEKEVGTGAIQLIWIYNGGNATVVFAKVEDAIKVKKRLDLLSETSEESSHYYALHTTFSKDPCIQPVHCISDLHV